MSRSAGPENSPLTANVNNLVSLVEYQPGTVVSRTVMDKSAGTVTLFAFAAGQGLSEHTAPFEALVYILDGQAQVSLGHQLLNLKAGEMTILPANSPHALKAVQPFKMLLVMIKA
jgi:quercetin dioxygenase-like cupin family protein